MGDYGQRATLIAELRQARARFDLALMAGTTRTIREQAIDAACDVMARVADFNRVYPRFRIEKQT